MWDSPTSLFLYPYISEEVSNMTEFNAGEELVHESSPGEKIIVVFKNQGQKNARVVFPDGREDLVPLTSLAKPTSPDDPTDLDTPVVLSPETPVSEIPVTPTQDPEPVTEGGEYEVSLQGLSQKSFPAANKEEAIKKYNEYMGVISTIHPYTVHQKH
jgi:hypothetical protein